MLATSVPRWMSYWPVPFVRKSKCEFATIEVEYLGHIVSNEGVATDSGKIRAMVEWPLPTIVRALLRFLGLAWYNCCFIQNYATIASPLIDLLKGGVRFVQWGRGTVVAIVPVLVLLDFRWPVELECDASDNGTSVVLMQNRHPIISFTSWVLLGQARALFTYERKKCLPLWRPFASGDHICWVVNSPSKRTKIA